MKCASVCNGREVISASFLAPTIPIFHSGFIAAGDTHFILLCLFH